MAMPSSQNIRSESEMVPELRPLMPVDLLKAVMKGDRDLLVQRLGLQPEEQTECRVTMEGASHSAPEEINTENQTVQSELQSATRFGDTILHLLVTEGHNELALKVFQRDMSLLKARNKMLESPLYCAAKVGNDKFLLDLIQRDLVVVKDALAQTNTNGDTALHVAAKNGHGAIGCRIMFLDPEMAFKVNNKLLSPLYLAIVNEQIVMVAAMLEVDPTLACTPFSDGMLPVHEAARTGNVLLVIHFMKCFPDDVELRDQRGRNLFHIAAEEKKKHFFLVLFKYIESKEILIEMTKRMNTTRDYEGNTPFHIASIVGDKIIMEAIWTNVKVAETVQNNQGLTPFELSARQLLEKTEDTGQQLLLDEYNMTKGEKFTEMWFQEVMEPITNKWDKVQVIGLGSVLITTVTFAATLTIPGGYNQDHGTPILGRKYMFKAFILANAMAFILGFISLYLILSGALIYLKASTLAFGAQAFQWAASCMVLTFGLGMYVTLAPVCYPIAVLLLVICLFLGSPFGFVSIEIGEIPFQSKGKFIFGLSVGVFAVVFLFIFCLALL